jgi:seryl-tRNA synthetase
LQLSLCHNHKMHPIQLLRKKDPALRAALARRGQPIDWENFDKLEIKRATAQLAIENERFIRKGLSEKAAEVRRAGQLTEFDEIQATVKARPVILPALEAEAAKLLDEQLLWCSALPNVPHPASPEGKSEYDDQVISVVGSPRQTGDSRDHVSIARDFGGIDTELAAKMSGSRFAVMTGSLARLHRALIQMMLDLHGDRGYKEAYVPYLVRSSALFGTGQLPKFEDDLFRTQDDLYLIPTAEVPLTNLIAGRILYPADLPLAWCSHTPCFRREAGAAGRDTSGLIRQHQFEKVELVRVESPVNSDEALERHILAGALEVMDALELPYRVLDLCAGDLGFSATRTFDIEVWLPSQRAYREISSCSNMGDFQARRMNARLRDGKNLIFPHTLNGSGLAVGRSLVAVLEAHIQPDGRLRIPERLRPHLGGRTHLEPEASGPAHNKPSF